MHMKIRQLALLIVGACLPCWILAGGAVTPKQDPRDFGPRDLRDAVEAHRYAQREEVQHEEAWAGRRLTPSELAQLREQVRQQWPARILVVAPAELRSGDRMGAAPVSTVVPVVRVWPARSERP